MQMANLVRRLAPSGGRTRARIWAGAFALAVAMATVLTLAVTGPAAAATVSSASASCHVHAWLPRHSSGGIYGAMNWRGACGNAYSHHRVTLQRKTSKGWVSVAHDTSSRYVATVRCHVGTYRTVANVPGHRDVSGSVRVNSC